MKIWTMADVDSLYILNQLVYLGKVGNITWEGPRKKGCYGLTCLEKAMVL
jgi:hypothetical protein